ncbi:phosphotriesterase family protein [Mucilaginibacter myungsuensis]|uniref:Phosphotriesterase n=1 Tax=Mucilaginibacter myungsuensis TaxID=649104 RepID=A0A929KZL8_9SPHI|nr:phosphotriesterase [Mucilaginibacter myungsuensis]MBE9661470.1 phosphotriesterase [Mucilaginibacter myungsuensis]MDN3597613.1 phosphotriesterase [Mucilaginibacter myungsuensis]
MYKKLFPTLYFLGLIILTLSACVLARSRTNHRVMTVTGYPDAATLGLMLPHEHIFTDFSGAETVTPRYDREEAFQFALPYLKKLKASGVNTIVECTPNYIDRDVALLKRLSEASGLNIITNTGYYAAVNFKYLPKHAYTETAQQLAGRWITEWRDGIAGTNVRPGFIKLGVGNAPLAPIERKLIEAAAITHLRTGLKIYIHTGDGKAAVEEADLLQSKGVSPSALIWVHAQNDATGVYQQQLAQRGVTISLDGYSPQQKAKYIGHLNQLKKASLLHKVILSHDNGFAVELEDGKITFKAFGGQAGDIYTSIQTDLIPALLKAGFDQQEIDLMTKTNPAKALTIEVLMAN